MSKWVLKPPRIVLCGTMAEVDLVDIPTRLCQKRNGRWVDDGTVYPPHLEVSTGHVYDTPDGKQVDSVDWTLPPDWRARLHMLPEYDG